MVAGLGFFVFMVYFYPRFNKAKGGKVNNAMHRGPCILEDDDLPGGWGVVESVIPYGNGEFTLLMRNKNGQFTKTYHEDFIIPKKTSQVLADQEAPRFTTVKAKYRGTSQDTDFRRLTDKYQTAIQERDKAKQELKNVKASVDEEVKNRAKEALEASKPSKIGWDGRK